MLALKAPPRASFSWMCARHFCVSQTIVPKARMSPEGLGTSWELGELRHVLHALDE